MKLLGKYRFAINVAGFVFLLLLMFLLNRQQEHRMQLPVHHYPIVIANQMCDFGLAAQAVQVPRENRGMLPLQIISHPNSFFLLVVNRAENLTCDHMFIVLKKRYLTYCQLIVSHALIEYVWALGNRDIQ